MMRKDIKLDKGVFFYMEGPSHDIGFINTLVRISRNGTIILAGQLCKLGLKVPALTR